MCYSDGGCPECYPSPSSGQVMHELAAGWGAVVGVLALPRFLDPKVPLGFPAAACSP